MDVYLFFKEMAERYRARGQSTIYDPYRYSYTIDEKKVIKDNQLTLIPKKEYEKIKDFHPFFCKQSMEMFMQFLVSIKTENEIRLLKSILWAGTFMRSN